MASAMMPDAMAADADVLLNSSVHELSCDVVLPGNQFNRHLKFV